MHNVVDWLLMYRAMPSYFTLNIVILAGCVDAYLDSPDTTADLLSYWLGKEKSWPKLAQCAKWVLSVPATSTSSERVFSVAGRKVDKRRSQLNLETVDGLLSLHGLCATRSTKSTPIESTQ